jgi:alpha-tubulin suppressor-like RCC1 family protein
MSEFTEVFSWGLNDHGQLGIGDHPQQVLQPVLCSYSISISQIACGAEHSAFITPSFLCYTMGSN